MTAALVIALLTAGGDLPAKTLPDAPRPTITAPEGNIAAAGAFAWPPKPAFERKPFWTRTVKLEAAAMVGLGAADMTQTCRFLARGERERNLTQSCAANVALTAAFDAAAIGGAWLLHRTGHDRLAKVPMAYMAGVSAYGIAESKRLKGW